MLFLRNRIKNYAHRRVGGGEAAANSSIHIDMMRFKKNTIDMVISFFGDKTENSSGKVPDLKLRTGQTKLGSTSASA